jgi:hypothetical protein
VNPREKTLILAVGSLAGLLVGGLGLRAFINRPLKEQDRQIAALRQELGKIALERRGYFVDEDKLKGFTQRTFSDDLDKASARSGEMLTKQILQSGLPETDFTRLPVGPRRLRGASEIGWNVQGDGGLVQVINLLFLLQESPYLHRLENVTVSPGERPGHVRVRFRFLTLVMEPALPVDWHEPEAKYTLDSPERRDLESIIARDILRPYIKRQLVPAGPHGTVASPAVLAAKPLPGPESLRVVSLSQWEGLPEIHVRDLVNQRTVRYQPGDPLAGGVVVMVDYRPLPFPDKPGLRSDSRVIIKIDNEYWAVERGRTLADKYKLSRGQLPENLLQL